VASEHTTIVHQPIDRVPGSLGFGVAESNNAI
jgi:hypothetical protein